MCTPPYIAKPLPYLPVHARKPLLRLFMQMPQTVGFPDFCGSFKKIRVFLWTNFCKEKCHRTYLLCKACRYHLSADPSRLPVFFREIIKKQSCDAFLRHSAPYQHFLFCFAAQYCAVVTQLRVAVFPYSVFFKFSVNCTPRRLQRFCHLCGAPVSVIYAF